MKQLLSSLAEYHDIQFNEAQLWQKPWRFSRNDTFQAHAGNFPGNTKFVKISINRNVERWYACKWNDNVTEIIKTNMAVKDRRVSEAEKNLVCIYQ